MLEWVSARSNNDRVLAAWPSCFRTKAATSSAIAAYRITVADTVAAKCGEPRPGQDPRCAPVGRPEGDRGPADEILDRDHADPALGRRKAAVEAVVAIVAHQEHMPGRDLDRREVVSRTSVDLVQDRVARASGQRVAKCRIETELPAAGRGDNR